MTNLTTIIKNTATGLAIAATSTFTLYGMYSGATGLYYGYHKSIEQKEKRVLEQRQTKDNYNNSSVLENKE